MASHGFTDADADDGNDPNKHASTSATSSYPPSQAHRYDYPPGQRHGLALDQQEDINNNSNSPGSVLPLHSSTRHPYPPLSHSWSRIQAWLAREYPELGDTLNYGILPLDLHQLQLQLEVPFPHTLRESFLRIDAQEVESYAGCTDGLFFGLPFLSMEEMVDEWKFWREVDDDPATGANPKLKERMRSIPAGWIRSEYSNRGWLPLITDRVGNYIGVDVNPGHGGAPGQVIVFGRDFDTKVVLWRGDGEAGWARWLASFAEELENHETFEIGNRDSNSEGSEDSIGHEPYFFDGSAQGNRGEGGGDGGAIGLRLNGEYRGWNVLEAIADRSVKKWKEAGLVTDAEYPHVDPRRTSAQLDSLHALPQDTGVEVPIPLVDEISDKLLPEPETPKPGSSTPGTSSNIIRPAPRPIDLPTRSDIAVDVDSGSPGDMDNVPPRDEFDLERGGRLPLQDSTSNGGVSLGGATTADRFSPRLSEEGARLLKRVSVEPPTPVSSQPPTKKGASEFGHPPARSPSPAKDLLNDDPPPAIPLPSATLIASNASGSTETAGNLPLADVHRPGTVPS